MTSIMSDWRAAADPDDLREYDRFGPWIDEIKDAVDMPRRFRPWWPELQAAAHLLKVPRPYDRAQIRPGMDLYESVIAVFPDTLCILRAESREVLRREVNRDEVVATVRYSNLLLGYWSLLLADGGRVEVEFNTVSQSTIADVDRYLMSPRLAADPHSVDAVRPEDHYFQSVTAALNAGASAAIEPVHVEEPGQPCRDQRNRRRRTAGMMVLASHHDLIIFNRDMEARPLLRRANYASNIIRLPYRLMSSFEIRRPEPTSPPSFAQLIITCDRQVVRQSSIASFDSVATLLMAHGVPEQRQRG